MIRTAEPKPGMFSGTRASLEHDVFRSRGIRQPGYLFFWLTSFALVLGFFSLATEQLDLLPLFLMAGYLTVLFAFVRTITRWSDLFNPLSMVLAIAFARLFCPALLLLIGAEPPDKAAAFYEMMGLSDRDWYLAHALAVAGVLSIVLGWLLVPGRWSDEARLNFYLPDEVLYAALVAMIAGLAAFLLFLHQNAALGAIASGSFRSTTIQEGTGKYFFMAYLLLVGAVVLSAYLLMKNYKWISLLPVVVCTLLYWVLGGRGRAMTSLGAGLFLLWYVYRERGGWKRRVFRPKYILVGAVGIFFTVWLLYVGALYRGGLGVDAFVVSLSLRGLWGYVESAAFTDIGQLHGLAGAVAVGPGVLEGKTFIGTFSWPLSKFFPIPGRSTGVYIIEELIGFSGEQRWGLHASLIGDSYVNFGLLGVIIVLTLFGMGIKWVYVKFRQGFLPCALYILAFVHSLQVFLGSIDVLWPQTLTIMCFAMFVLWLSKTVFKLR